MTRRYCWNTHSELRDAVQYVVEGDSFFKAYKKTGVGPNTIKKYYLQYVNKSQIKEKKKPTVPIKNDVKDTVFTPEQEVELMKCFKHFEYLFYGLSDTECRMLAYQMVISEDMKIPVGWKQGMASIVWLTSFQLNQPNFMNNLEKPERFCTRSKLQRSRVSERNIIWENKTVTNFYDDLEKIMQKSPELKDNKRIYSLDEAYTSIDPEIMTVDRENRIDLLTTCCFICADGTSLPPVVIKPYLPFNILSDIPPGTAVLSGSLGRMKPDLFTETLHHFVKHSHSSLSNPSILIMDTDLSHLSYAAVALAKESGVHILTLHPHVNKLLQPLQGEVFDLFHKSYYDAMELWWTVHEDENVSSCDFGKFLIEAYSKAMTSENILKGFKKCGISPFDRDLFTDTDFLSCIDILDEQPCIECRLRDNRRKKPGYQTSAGKKDGSERESLDKSQESKNAADDGGESSQSHEIRTEDPTACREKHKKYCWSTDSELRDALRYVAEGDSFYKASKKSGIGPNTIKKYYLQYVHHPQFFNNATENIKPSAPLNNDVEITVFTPEQEVELMKCFKHFENLFHGLSETECRMLAYQMVISEDIKIPVGWHHGKASIAWLTSFQLNQSSFMNNLEKPERFCTRSKLQRSQISERNIIWENKTVTNFYDDLEKNMQKSPELKDNKRIYSLDEAYTSIDPEIMTVDRESRIDLLTTCCFICADGTSLPPVVIKPFLPFDIRIDIPPGTVVLPGSLGRMSPDLFTDTMHHFVKHSHSSLSNPSILIMDIDLSHLSHDAVALAKESGVHILTLHPHVNKLLQPLQGEMFDLFHKSYYDAMELWWTVHKDENVSSCDFGKFLSDAYSEAMTSENILKGFKKCGINPFDRDLFTDTDFLSCKAILEEQPCIECRLRDHRCRISGYQRSAGKKDEGERGSSDESQLEESKNPADDGGESIQSPEINTEDPEACSDGAMSQPRTKSGQELDKLKRRLIRSVARLVKEKKSDDEVWDELRKECGTNCKVLWLRMRSLTLKKLKRLLDADDRTDNVPAVARMTLTDWLLYDLVLVHEKIDVINRGSMTDSTVLSNLFSLVQRFQIEGRAGDDLAEAWTAATVSYNSKGHQCSPMLMQRRWFQLKELTRHKLYQFWFSYRGNERLLLAAKQDPPTPLQRAIALRYPDVVTKEFPTWDERVAQQLVIMPEEFEIKMRKKDLMKPCDEAVPDVVIVEEKIDTITVDSDSDIDEIDRESALLDQDVIDNDETTQTPVIVQVKTEPEDPNEIDITEHYLYQEEPKDKFQHAIESLEMEEDRMEMSHVTAGETSEVIDCMMPLITSVKGAVDETKLFQNMSLEHNDVEMIVQNSTEIDYTEPNTIANQPKTFNKQFEGVLNTFDDNSQESIVIDDNDEDIKPAIDKALDRRITSPSNQIESNVIDITSPNAKQYKEDSDRVTSVAQYTHFVHSKDSEEPFENKNLGPVVTATSSGSPVKAKMEHNTDLTNKENTDDEMAEDLVEDIIKVTTENSNLYLSNEAVTETNIADDGFEFADDGIEYHEDHNDQDELNETPELSEEENAAPESPGTPKFDLKLLMNPIVYTTKIDDMKVYKGRSLFDTIDKKKLVDEIILESKPVSAKAINVEQIKVSENQNIEEENDNVQVKVENSDEFDDDLFQNEASNNYDSDKSETSPYDDNQRVKLSSSLLQKPRSRSYNPIQLCKNPDFNTRLKRLTVGFFSSKRNRVFLKACKPMTIDLSKAFESKLVSGTMYLKPSDPVVIKEVEDVSESAASIMPSAVAVQSLMDTADVDKILQTELEKRMLERKKTVSLPNISVVRKINQHLLMAEVAPIVTQAEKYAQEAMNVVNNTETLEKTNSKNVNAETVTGTSANPFNHTLPLMNIDNSRKETVTNITNPVAKYGKSKEDNIPKKPKKTLQRSNTRLPLWLTKASYNESKPYSDSLLTIDTLFKVLNALDPSSVNYKRKTKGHQSTNIHSKPGRPWGSRTKVSNSKTTTNSDLQKEQSSKSIPTDNSTTLDSPTDNSIIIDSLTDNSIIIDSPTDNSTTIDQSIDNSTTIDPPTDISTTRDPHTYILTTKDPSTENPPTTNQPTSTENKATPTNPKKQRSCCWARARINILKGTSKTKPKKHKCPMSLCKCCCKEILRQTEINYEIKLLEQMVENHDNFDETIEHVVQQSRNSSNVAIRHPSLEEYHPQKQQTTDLSNVLMASVAHVRHPRRPLNTSVMAEQIGMSIRIQADETDDHDTVSKINDTEDVDSVTPVPEYEAEETIDLVDDDENELQPPKPKIRVHAADPPSYQVLNTTGLKKVQINKNKLSPTVVSPIVVNSTPQLPGLVPISLKPGGSREKLKTVAGTSAAASKPSSKEPDEANGNEPPCSCRPNVALDKTSSMLVVDGSNECLRHSKSRVSKETRIYLNRKHMSAGTRPFYVGKNKILLTNVHLAKKAEPPPPPPPPPPPAPETPLEVPEGVQVLLLHDGSVSYVVDPGITLTPEEIEKMPTVLAAIQEQLKASGVTRVTDPALETVTTSSTSNDVPKAVDSTSDVKNNESIIDNQNSENNSVIEKASSNSQSDQINLEEKAIQGSSKADKVANQTELENQDAKQETSCGSSSEQSSVCSKSDLNIDYTAEGAEKQNTSEGPENNNPEHGSESENTNKAAESKNTNNTVASASRNLLSDLMEMSGILEEDGISAPQTLGMDTSQDSSTHSFSMSASITPVVHGDSISAQINEKQYNLNPITSFAELKYACDNNGLFFKLDLNNGIIVPINVCIQKTPDMSIAKNATPSEVIDLTDEHSFVIGEPVTHSKIQVNPRSELEPVKKVTIKKSQVVKSGDGIKRPRGRPSMYSKSLLLEKQSEKEKELPISSLPMEERKKVLMKRLSNNLKPLKMQPEKRSLVNILRKNLISRSTSVLERISNLKTKKQSETTDYSVQDSSEESDDEPLAKLAKRMRRDDSGEQTNTQESQGVSQDENMEDDGDVDFEDAIDAMKPVKPPTILNSLFPTDEPMAEPVPTQLVLSGHAVEQPLPNMITHSLNLNENESDDDSSEENCILGF